MNFQFINANIPPSKDEYFRDPICKSSHYIQTDAFTVLPPFSPQIPGPPPTPNPYRILPPIVSRKRPSFVILQEIGSHPVSREPSPSGRVSPFRGCGFKPPSRETSPSRPPPEDELANCHRSRSRLPIATRKSISRKFSKSVSPVGDKTSAIPRPLNRRISYSPGRAAQVLKDVKSVSASRTQSLSRALKSSENTRNLRTSNLGASKDQLRGSISNLRQQKPSPTSHSQKHTTPKSPVKGKPMITTASPTKLKSIQPCRFSPVKKINENSGSKEGMKSKGEVCGRINYASTNSKRSKENVLPGSSPVRTTKPPPRPSMKTATKSPMRVPKSPLRSSTFSGKFTSKQSGTPTLKKKLEGPAKKEIPSDSPTASKAEECSARSTTSLAAKSEPASKPSDKSNTVRSVGKKAMTTGNLLNSIKNKKIENEKLTKTEDNEKNEDEKKTLVHTDTSRSLQIPISIETSNLTQSSVTLIRTTTEPALAPVEPELISEIRSAINESRASEEVQCIKQELSTVKSEPLSSAIGAADNSEQLKRKSNLTEEMTKTEKAEVNVTSPKVETKNSPRPVHVIAVTKILEEPRKPEITTKVINIAQKVESELLGSNDSAQNGNRNGISKSSWLNESIVSEPMTKTLPITTKQKQSLECLVTKEKPTRWKKFTAQCSKKVGKLEKHQAQPEKTQISTITEGSMREKLPTKKSVFGRYFCRFCYKCKLKNRQGMMEDRKKGGRTENNECKSSSRMRCLRCGNCFKQLFCKMTSRQKKMERKDCKKEKEAASVAAGVVPMPRKSSCCAGCRHAVMRCVGIFCCWNTAVCLKLRSKCGKWCSCCKKCSSCCRTKQKTVITETERRRSVMSTTRKRKWTKMLTDFPKLDPSFVEHGSIMRGAIPVLPVPLAWICLILNVFLPGFGTLTSGIFCLFVGKPRFSINDSLASRFGALLVNLLVSGSQLFTVLFCLVGWGWSVWWGVMMLKMARKNKRVMMAEQAVNRPLGIIAGEHRKNQDVERGGTT